MLQQPTTPPKNPKAEDTSSPREKKEKKDKKDKKEKRRLAGVQSLAAERQIVKENLVGAQAVLNLFQPGLAALAKEGQRKADLALDFRRLFKEGQRHLTPPVADATRAFYESLLKENPDSKIAVRYIVEHGILTPEERKPLLKKYQAVKTAKMVALGISPAQKMGSAAQKMKMKMMQKVGGSVAAGPMQKAAAALAGKRKAGLI